MDRLAYKGSVAEGEITISSFLQPDGTLYAVHPFRGHQGEKRRILGFPVERRPKDADDWLRVIQVIGPRRRELCVSFDSEKPMTGAQWATLERFIEERHRGSRMFVDFDYGDQERSKVFEPPLCASAIRSYLAGKGLV